MTRMSMTTPAELPDLEAASEAIRLSEAVAAAERARRPSGTVLRFDELNPLPRTPQYLELRAFLAGLPDERIAEIHALYWLGRDGFGRSESYPGLLRHAFNNLEHGVSYLMAKPLGEGLRRGLEVLGLDAGPRRTDGHALSHDESFQEV